MKFWIKQFFCDPKAHRLALYEVTVVCVISLIPLFALAVIDQLHRGSADVTEMFWDALGTGQLYLYSFALFGTLFWLCQKEHENFPRFGPRLFFMLVIFVPCVLIIIIYSTNPGMATPLAPTFVHLSFLIYGLYAVLYYILLVFDHLEPPSVEEGLQEATETLISEFEQTGG